VGITQICGQEVEDKHTEESTDTSRWQPLLRLDIAILVELRFLDIVHIGEKANQSDEAADEDTQVSQTTCLKRPAVDLVEDNRKRLKPTV